MSKKLIVSILVLVVVLAAGVYILTNPNLRVSLSNSKASYGGGEFAGSSGGPTPREFQRIANENTDSNYILTWQYIGEDASGQERNSTYQDCTSAAANASGSSGKNKGVCHFEWWQDSYGNPVMYYWLFEYIYIGRDTVE